MTLLWHWQSALFHWGNGKLQRKDYVIMSCSASFGWNGQLCGWFLQVKSWVLSLLLCCCPHRGCSVESIFHSRKIDCFTKLSATEIQVSIGGFLEIKAHAHTRHSFFFPLPSAPGTRLLSSCMGMKDGGCLFKFVWCEVVVMTLKCKNTTNMSILTTWGRTFFSLFMCSQQMGNDIL